MRALRVIPLLVILLFLVYLGVLFVEANQEPVIVSLGLHTTAPTRLGFVVMTSVLIGIFVGAFLASAQVVLLFLQNRSLKKQITRSNSQSVAPKGEFSEDLTSSSDDYHAP